MALVKTSIRMLTFPNAKINLGLRILYKRPDGFHEIDSCFYPVGWQDALEIQIAVTTAFQSTGITIDGKGSDNLCMKAYQLLSQDHSLPPVTIHLHKNIPIGAGLGGGSANAAFTIDMLNEKFKLGLSSEEMQAYAAQIGSDCPFFIDNKPMMVGGRGEVLTASSLSLKGKCLLLVYPNLHISTGEAYRGIHPQQPEYSCQEILSKPIGEWKSLLKNDFEDSLFPKYPQLSILKEELYEMGAIYASMTGSGSTVFGIFDEKPKAPQKWPSDYKVYIGAFF